MELRPAVRRFAEEMERVMRKNDFKSGIEEMEDWTLLLCVSGETYELQEALAVAKHAARAPLRRVDTSAVLREVIDVANYAAHFSELEEGADG